MYLWLLTFKMVRVELYVQNKCVFEKLSETDRIYSRKGMRYLFLNLIAEPIRALVPDAATRIEPETSALTLGRVVFSA